MASTQHDWKRNPASQVLLNPWSKWVKRNVSNKPAKKEVRFQREIQQYISCPVPGESRYPMTATHTGIRHEPPEQPPTPEKLLSSLSKDDKNYLIGQKLAPLLSQDQQKRLLRDALDAGKLPPGTNASSNCICPDIVADIQTMIRAEFDHGLSQTQVMVAPPANHVVVINQGFEKPLPGLPSYGPGGIDLAKNAEVFFSNGSGITHAIPRKPVGSPPPVHVSQQKLELTSLRFPKPGIEPFLHCAPCQSDHPTRLFSPAQRRMPPGLRRCIAREGYIRLCAHKVVTWGLVEACLLKGLACQDMDLEHDTFTFRCQHPSHPRAPEAIIYSALTDPDDYESQGHFGRVVLRWSTTQPACSPPFSLPPELPTNDMYQQGSSSDLAEDGALRPSKNVICPGPLTPIAPQHSVPDSANLEVPGLEIHRLQSLPRPDSRSSHRLSSDLSSTLSSSHTRTSYSSFNTSIGSPGWLPHASQPTMTDHVYSYHPRPSTNTSHTPELKPPSKFPPTRRPPIPTNTNGADSQLIQGEMTVNAVDLPPLEIDDDDDLVVMEQPQPVSPMTESDNYSYYEYTNPPAAEPSIASTSPSTNPISQARQTPTSRGSTITSRTRINPSAEWFAAVHPDSYSLDRWAKEGLFGLRWCSEPECKSYVGLLGGTEQTTGGYLRGGGVVHRVCRGGCCP